MEDNVMQSILGACLEFVVGIGTVRLLNQYREISGA